MKHLYIRFQLVFVSIILLLTFGMMMSLVIRYNKRWDMTEDKIYSLSSTTSELLQKMQSAPVEIMAFYPHDDPARKDLETFFKECQMHHPDFNFQFYDPDRYPQLAKQWQVHALYTVIIRYKNYQERIVRPNEELFANALYKLQNPRNISLCFVTGHGEANLSSKEQNGLMIFKQNLLENNYTVHDILLERDAVPSTCQIVAIMGPQQDWQDNEIGLIKKSFAEGQSILFLIDPVDPGTGNSFVSMMKDIGVHLGADVIVDKMSRMVGGDFLVPFVNQYSPGHPVTKEFNMATFFPVARSLQAEVNPKENIEVVPIAFSGTGSWAETDLVKLEKGEANFEAESDSPGPIPLAVAVVNHMPTLQGQVLTGTEARMVIVGDSDFITNAYADLAGNKDFAMRIVRWLSKDDRTAGFFRPKFEFQALSINAKQRILLLSVTLLAYPILFLLMGIAEIFLRRRMG